MSSVDKLSKKRNIPISRITEAYNLAIKTKSDSSQKGYFQAIYENLDESYEEFKRIHNDIIGLLETDAEFKTHDSIRKEADQFYFKTKAAYNEIFPDSNRGFSTNLVSISNQNNKEVRLPKLTVPNFDGNLRKWPTFYDIFLSLVHENDSLSQIQKFQYLLSFLEGEPLNIIRSIQTIGSNYEIAFKTLVDRYHNTRMLATTYWNAIYSAPTLKNNSSKELRGLLDIFTENVSALEVLKFPVNHWCFILFNILLQKLDVSTRTAFEIEVSKIELPTYKNLLDFLNNHCKALESVQYISSNQIVTQNKTFKTPNFSQNTSHIKSSNYSSKYQHPSVLLTNSEQINNTIKPKQDNFSQQTSQGQAPKQKCQLCKNISHPLSHCPVFISKSPFDRFSHIKQQHACINCLRSSHLLKDCPSTFNCKTCNYRHHTMLHLPQNINRQQNNTSLTNANFSRPLSNSNTLVSSQCPSSANLLPNTANLEQNFLDPNRVESESQTPSQKTPSLNCGCTALSTSMPHTTILLSTTKVEILDGRGNYQTVRVVLDSASQANFISENCLNRLGLKRKRQLVSVLGLNQTASTTNGISSCTIRPLGKTDPTFYFDAFVLPKLCSDMPSVQINPQSWTHISNIPLGDDQFHIPAPVDMLLGADIYSQILMSGRIVGHPGQPIALETIFGWVLLGKTHNLSSTSSSVTNLCTLLDSSLDITIRKFWELESVTSKAYFSPDDQKCENLYQKTTFRDTSGRFVVSLPFRQSKPELGDTYSLAYRCFMSLESRLLKNPDLYLLYSDFMRDYIKNGHMSLIPNNSLTSSLVCYLPHHGVLKPDKTTSKLRVVFNASAKGSKGLSLNDTLLAGPKLQTDITTVLLKFRFHPVVFLADIKQMYLQILVTPEHRDYQRLLWRFSPSDPLEEYRLNCVTFGVSSSPYLAIRTIRELASQESQRYPEACRILLEDIFMDDICSGSADLKTALSLQQDLIKILRSAGFELRKWASNNSKFLTSLPPSDCQLPISFDTEPSCIKVLGLQWNPSLDSFSYSCNPSEKPCTKRNILSEIAKIFDPLGFLSPVTFLAKHIMQRLWIEKIGWDERPSQVIIELWSNFKNELSSLSKLSLPRFAFAQRIQSCQLFGFCDASEIGYAAAVYVRVELPNNLIQSSLLIAKSKVAPLKTITIPRLELLGATLLADLLDMVLSTYSSLVSFDKIYAFSDSQVVLAWLASSPHKWKTFVANRVSHIQEKIPNISWYHVSTLDNPADCASRGVTPKTLEKYSLWFQGPPWVTFPQSDWNFQLFSASGNNIPEIKHEEKTLVLSVLTESNFIDNLLDAISSLPKIQRIICYCLKFIHNSRFKSNKLLEKSSSLDLHRALLILVKHVQSQFFSNLISQIKKNELLPKPFRKLAPFLDEAGFVRVGGRLRNSEISFEAKHPLLLPRNSRLTDLLIEQIHKEHFHIGLNTVQYLLRQQFWVLSPRRAIHKVLSKCIICFRLKPKAYTPFMGDLPAFRISQLKCFSHTTLDYAGPFSITMGKYRGAKVSKAYICIFVCGATKAVHIELVSSLSADAFIAALRRFIARRGTCSALYSDCGTNFKGANKLLQDSFKYASESLNIKWHFNPPASPHMNGLSEAGVKSVKTHLYRVVGDQILTYEELLTFLTQIEAILNSRPLCAQSSDPNDLSPLTPGHFLTMEPLNSCPDPDLSTLKLNTLSRWQLIQRLHADFWKRWKDEYLHTLQQRSKWTDPSVKVELNTLVLVRDETKPPLHWALGRIVALHPGQDGHVRVVTVKTQLGFFKRPIVKLCPLPVNAQVDKQ